MGCVERPDVEVRHDGAVASDFLRTVKSFLEEPGLML